MSAFVGRTLRTVRAIARDGRIPRPIRWAAVLGLAPIPGPVDEVVLLLVAAALWLFWRELLVEAWRQEARGQSVARDGAEVRLERSALDDL